MQSGLWRDTYGDPTAHNGAVRGLACDNLNKIVISGGSDAKIKFWPFKCKGNLHHLNSDFKRNFQTNLFQAKYVKVSTRQKQLVSLDRIKKVLCLPLHWRISL